MKYTFVCDCIHCRYAHTSDTVKMTRFVSLYLLDILTRVNDSDKLIFAFRSTSSIYRMFQISAKFIKWYTYSFIDLMPVNSRL